MKHEQPYPLRKNEMAQYREWLDLRQYSEATKINYLGFLNRMGDYAYIDQELINHICAEIQYPLVRNFLRNFLKFRNITDLEVPPIRGRIQHKELDFDAIPTYDEIM